MTANASLLAAMRRARLWLERKDTPRIILVTGPEGVGKTALAETLLGSGGRSDQGYVRAAPATMGRAARLTRFVRHLTRESLLLEDIDDLPRATQARLAFDLNQRVGITILTARLETDETIETLGLAPALCHLAMRCHVEVPSLRERPEDIALLTSTWSHQGLTLDEASREYLRSHAWPGNARELRALLAGASKLAAGDGCGQLTRDLLVRAHSGPTPIAPPLHAAILAESCASSDALEGLSLRCATRLVEAAMIAHALKASGGNIALAGRRLRTPHSTLKSRVQALRLEVKAVSHWI